MSTLALEKRPTKSRRVASFAPRSRPAKSRTLARRSVKKPGPSLKRQLHVSHELRPKGSEIVPRYIRDLHVKEHDLTLAKSASITHFSDTSPSIELEPAEKPKEHHAKHLSEEVPSAPAPKSKLDYMLEKALEDSNSHLERPEKVKTKAKKHKKYLVINLVLLLALLIFVAANFNRIRLYVASNKAGFVAALPTNPSGFGLSDISYGIGYVNTVFKHGNSSYTITQQTSNLDSQQLVASVVSPQDPNYDVVPTSQKTIYLYGSRNASWVTNGVLYTIKSDGNLSDQQLVSIASST
ncbi:MAG TPA: hypothetical protein VL989_00710 [Candidatus Sulfotelmatobacter sp.]|nr:hypothetical protein [Candidatus Sulfotelmatobacter sp.]